MRRRIGLLAALSAIATSALLLVNQNVALAGELPRLVITPAAFSEGLDGTLSPASAPVTVSGTSCVPHEGAPASILLTVEGVESLAGKVYTATPDATGAWSITFELDGPTSGTVHATCDDYLGSLSYPAEGIPIAVAAPTGGVYSDPTAYVVGATSVPAGSTITIGGRDWASYAHLDISLHSARAVTLRSIDADEEGAFEAAVVIPADTPAGRHEIVVAGTRSTRRIAITVLAAGLANSGADIGPHIVVGGVLLLLGTGLTLAGRRRRSVATA